MTRRIFMSASVPLAGRGIFHEDANPFLIQFAVRELLTVCLGRRLLVWGGHPAITPMVWAVCEDLGVDYAKNVVLYQSTLFSDFFPEENAHFANVVKVDAVGNDRPASLAAMRTQMLAPPFEAAVFIGGMEGIIDEHQIFSLTHPKAQIVPVSSPGGAARQLAKNLGREDDRIDFARFFEEKLSIDPNEPRNQVP
ncbi:MAG: hypothetical protein EOP38_00330 [Rubrivivax sp.]|nr:MAG: hypothetical protein EOP38_00330 [Rubrivivax sp.]